MEAPSGSSLSYNEQKPADLMETRSPKSSESICVIRSHCKDRIKLVLDIGVQYQTPYLLDSCRDLRHVLVEPCQVYHEAIKKNYEGVDFTLLDVAAADKDSTLHLVSVANNPREPERITHSYVTSSAERAPGHAVEIRSINAMSVDTILEMQGCRESGSCLVKIDVDGIEESIMAGIARSSHAIGVLIVEASLDSIAHKIRIAAQAGFDLFDITDHGYYYKVLTQVELLFVNQALKLEYPMLDPWRATKGRLHPEHWQHQP